MKSILSTATVLIALLSLTELAAAKSISSGLSMSQYRNRCLAAGGTVTNVSAGGVKCRLPSGATVTCYDHDGPGISCDYRTASGINKLFDMDAGGMQMN